MTVHAYDSAAFELSLQKPDRGSVKNHVGYVSVLLVSVVKLEDHRVSLAAIRAAVHR
jgi:hypothetical protein